MENLISRNRLRLSTLLALTLAVCIAAGLSTSARAETLLRTKYCGNFWENCNTVETAPYVNPDYQPEWLFSRSVLESGTPSQPRYVSTAPFIGLWGSGTGPNVNSPCIWASPEPTAGPYGGFHFQSSHEDATASVQLLRGNNAECGTPPAPTWHNWTSDLGAVIPSGSAPTAISTRIGHAGVMTRGTDNALYYKEEIGSPHPWMSLGGSLTSDPAAASPSPGRIDVFARGAGNALYHKWRNGSWSGWESLGGSITSAPAAISFGGGHLDVYAQGANNETYHRWYTPGTGWSSWSSIGVAPIVGAVSAVSSSSGQIDLFGRGSDNTLRHRSYVNGIGWSAWESLGGVLTSDPSAASFGVGHLDVYVRGSDNAVWHRGYTNFAWQNWQSIGGNLTSRPSAISRGPNEIRVYGRDSNGNLGSNFFAAY